MPFPPPRGASSMAPREPSASPSSMTITSQASAASAYGAGGELLKVGEAGQASRPIAGLLERVRARTRLLGPTGGLRALPTLRNRSSQAQLDVMLWKLDSVASRSDFLGSRPPVIP